MSILFAHPLFKKGLTDNADTLADVTYAADDFVLVLGATRPSPTEGQTAQVEVHLIISPSLAADPDGLTTYDEAPNNSVIFGNSAVWSKEGTLGLTDGTWVGAAMT